MEGLWPEDCPPALDMIIVRPKDTRLVHATQRPLWPPPVAGASSMFELSPTWRPQRDPLSSRNSSRASLQSAQIICSDGSPHREHGTSFFVDAGFLPGLATELGFVAGAAWVAAGRDAAGAEAGLAGAAGVEAAAGFVREGG